MELDVRQEFEEIYGHLVKRVLEFNPSSNDGPGDPGPVKMIEAGFDHCESGWLAIIFDTRTDAEPDGEWTSHIDGNAFPRPRWEAADMKLQNNHSITVLDLEGCEKTLTVWDDLTPVIGELIKSVLLKARADGVFNKLPKSTECELGIEHLNGHYGWPAYEDRGEENLL